MKSVKICAIACIIAVAAVAGTAFANYGNATNENFSSQVDMGLLKFRKIRNSRPLWVLMASI